MQRGRAVLIRDIANAPHGFLPSVVGFSPDGTLGVGSAAEQFIVAHPDRAVAEAKRCMGQDVHFSLAGETFAPQEVAAIILRHLKQECERALGEEIREAVITVPAYFTNVQRQATRDAGEMAGLVVRRLINEPTAAALAYGLERQGAEEKILVYDLGGGTFDVTVLELSEGVLDVHASTGNPQLGGKDFDECLMRFLAERCRDETGIDLYETPRLNQRLKAAAKRAKEELSGNERTIVSLDNLALSSAGVPVNFTYTLTRAAFEAQVEHLVTSTAQQLDTVLREARLSSRDIATVLLVGGSTRMPIVRKFVSAYFGGKTLRTEIDPDEAVALGAAVLAGMETQTVDPSTLVITDVSPHTLGVAVQRSGENGDRQPGYFDPLIRKQSTIPRTAKQTYYTIHDNQESVRVQVYQGDAEMAADNDHVGDFVLDGLPACRAGAPIEVEFSYNLSGELEVVARAVQWRLEKRVIMQPSTRSLSPTEKASARRRLNRLWSEPRTPAEAASTSAAARSEGEAGWRTSRHYSRVAALMTLAERKLPTLAPEAATRVAALIKSMRAALAKDDEPALERDERALTDVLFDLG